MLLSAMKLRARTLQESNQLSTLSIQPKYIQ
jgi:hypothetical protein